MRRLLSSLILLATAATAHAGWVSVGGGELFKDTHNPFFLRNVDTVRYCVNIAPTSVSASPATVHTAVQEAIAYWQNEFNKVAQGAGAGQFTLGTQTFTEVPCAAGDDGIQLRFQFGFETLSDMQKQTLGDPTDYVGVAIRTDYDDQLRGKGFIFIASDMGPNSYHHGTDDTLITQAWRHPKLLKYALLHELGHIFGLPHTGSGLMSETFLEQILSIDLAEAFEKTPIESFFAPDGELDFCGFDMMSDSALSWFGAPAEDTCLHLSQQAGGTRWMITSSHPGGPSTALGQLIGGAPDLMDFHVRPAIVLQLMGNTSVFTPSETKFRPFMFGPMFVDMGLPGNFIPVKGTAKPTYLRLTPDTLQVQAADAGGKVQMLLSYFSPIGILLLKDPTPAPGFKE